MTFLLKLKNIYIIIFNDKLENKKYHTFGNVLKSNREIVETHQNPNPYHRKNMMHFLDDDTYANNVLDFFVVVFFCFFVFGKYDKKKYRLKNIKKTKKKKKHIL